MQPSVELNTWLDVASSEERDALAAASEVSVGYLYQLASGRRFPSADVAGRIEVATRIMHRTSGGRLPEICRTTLSYACSQCPFAKACLSQKKKGA